MERFDELRSRAARALQIYLVLIGCARQRQTITYGQLAALIGMPGAYRALGRILDLLDKWTRQEGLPVIVALAVNEETGLPGDRFYSGARIDDAAAWPRALVDVFGYDWLVVVPPTIKQLQALDEEIAV